MSFEISANPLSVPKRALTVRANSPRSCGVSELPAGAIQYDIAAVSPGASIAANVVRSAASSCPCQRSWSVLRPHANAIEHKAAHAPSPIPVHAKPRPRKSAPLERIRSSAMIPSVTANTPAKSTPRHDVSSANAPIATDAIESRLLGIAGFGDAEGGTGGVGGSSGADKQLVISRTTIGCHGSTLQK